MAIGKVLMLDLLASYTGQPIAVLCSGSWYRGVLKEVGTDYIILDPARAVAQTGPFNAEKPAVESAIASAAIVSAANVELVCQPAWAWFEMPVAKPQRK